MTLKRIFCALLCLLLIVGAPVMAEEDKDARIAELEAQVAELQAQVDAYHLKEIVASFDGGEVPLEDAEQLYNEYVNMYAQYGIDIAAYGMEDMLRESVITALADPITRCIPCLSSRCAIPVLPALADCRRVQRLACHIQPAGSFYT